MSPDDARLRGDDMAEQKSKYRYEKKSAWGQFSQEQIKKAYDFSDEYKAYLTAVKTEREAVAYICNEAKKNNTQFLVQKNKAVAVMVPGKQPLQQGLRIIISHIDSPRLDFKQVPLFEDTDSHLALCETHYYGGIKKFHWVVIPLALHGVIITKNGKHVSVTIGEKPEDPVFAVPDLLPHLSHEVQDTKKMNEAIKGEVLDVVVGSKPLTGNMKEKIKAGILDHLHNEYGMIEEDFVSAELEAVPAFSARDIGLDRSLIGGYGQDDRACAYTALQAILQTKNPTYTALALFVDKEEIGSEGSATAQVTTFLRSVIKKLDPKCDVDQVMLNSKVISADVNAAVTPNYTDVFELKNASALGYGVVMSKYTGHGGKYAANDASAEFVGEIRRLLNKKKIPWQTGELGKVDKGGGGTVAKFFSRHGMDVIDLGPSVLSMHSPFEVTSKADIYSTFLAYHVFLGQ